MYNHYIKTSFISSCLWHLRDNKTDFNLIIVYFYIHGKLFILRNDKLLLHRNEDNKIIRCFVPVLLLFMFFILFLVEI